jgi:hypothetical protein
MFAFRLFQLADLAVASVLSDQVDTSGREEVAQDHAPA